MKKANKSLMVKRLNFRYDQKIIKFIVIGTEVRKKT